MGTLHCSICDSTNLTQVGLTARQIKAGYYKCLDPECGAIMIPFVMPTLVEEQPEEQ